jgi:hypothetical protein
MSLAENLPTVDSFPFAEQLMSHLAQRMAAILVLSFHATASACPFCASPAAAQVRAAIFQAESLLVALAVAAPFGLLAVVLVLYCRGVLPWTDPHRSINPMSTKN